MRDPKLWAQDVKASDVISLTEPESMLVAMGEAWFPALDLHGVEDLIRAAQHDGYMQGRADAAQEARLDALALRSRIVELEAQAKARAT